MFTIQKQTKSGVVTMTTSSKKECDSLLKDKRFSLVPEKKEDSKPEDSKKAGK